MKQAQQMASLFEKSKVDLSKSKSEKQTTLNVDKDNGVDKNTPLYDSCINNPDVEIDAVGKR